MIPATAVLAVVLTTSNERDALTSRWTHASHVAVAASRRLRQGAAPPEEALVSVHGLAVAELSAPGRYHLHDVAAPPANPTWWERLTAWVGSQWNALVQALFGRVRVNPTAAAFVGDLVIALLVLAVAAAAIRLIVVYGRRGSRAASVRTLTPADDAATLYAMAAQRAERGEYAAAAQLLFRATLTLLDVRGTVRDDASATVGEIRRSLPERDVVPAFDAVAAMFVAGTYAERPLDALQWERARDAYLTLAQEPAA